MNKRALANLTLSVLLVIGLAGLTFVGYRQLLNARGAATLSSNIGRVHQLRMGLLNYEDTFTIPVTSPLTAPDISWRVKILPFIEERSLFEQYAFDKAWDSVENQSLFHACPRFFARDKRGQFSEMLMVTPTSSSNFANAPPPEPWWILVDSEIFKVIWTQPTDVSEAELIAGLQRAINEKTIHRNDKVVVLRFASGQQIKAISVQELLVDLQANLPP